MIASLVSALTPGKSADTPGQSSEKFTAAHSARAAHRAAAAARSAARGLAMSLGTNALGNENMPASVQP
jgi:hypothetical protein